MFSSDQNIESVRELCGEVRKYVRLRLRLARLDFVDKMTALLSALIVGAVLLVLLAIVVLFLSYTAALALSQWLGGMTAAFGLVTAVYLLAAVLVYAFRRRLVFDPMARFLGNLFLEEAHEGKEGGA